MAQLLDLPDELLKVVLEDVMLETGSFEHLARVMLVCKKFARCARLGSRWKLNARRTRCMQLVEFMRTLPESAGIVSLDLSDNDFQEEHWEMLTVEIEKMAELTYLDLSHSKMYAEGVSLVAPKLSGLKKLRTLSMGTNYLDDDGAAALASSLCTFTGLTSLCLRDSQIDDLGVLAPALGCLTGLTDLSLAANALSDAGAASLASALGQCSLTSLDLESIEISAGAKVLGPAICKLGSLRELRLGETRIGNALVPGLRNLTRLNMLLLNSTGIGREEVGALSEELVGLTRLVCLNLRDNQFMPEHGAERLVPVLKSLTRLEDLDLSNSYFPTNLARKHTPRLAPALSVLTSLTSLTLDGNRMGSKSMEVVALAVGKLRMLRLLSLSYNDFLDAGAEALAPQLKHLTRLVNLNLRGNDIMARGACALASVLGALTCLRSLDLFDNEFGLVGVRALVPVLSTLPRLSYIALGADGVAEKDWSQLKKTVKTVYYWNIPLIQKKSKKRNRDM